MVKYPRSEYFLYASTLRTRGVTKLQWKSSRNLKSGTELSQATKGHIWITVDRRKEHISTKKLRLTSEICNLEMSEFQKL